MEERDVYVAELWNQALEYRRGGHSALLRPAPFSPDLATIERDDVSGEVLLHEDVRSKPGLMGAYHDALQSELRPLAEARPPREALRT